MKTYTSEQLSDPQNAALLEEIILLISHTFTEDAGHKWLFFRHSRESFVEVLPHYIRALVRLAILSEAVFKVVTKDELVVAAGKGDMNSAREQPQVELPPDDTIRAVAIVIPPHGNATFDSSTAIVRAGMLALPWKCGLGMAWRLSRVFLPEVRRMHDEMFPDPSLKYHNWHLLILATHPESQGQGVGKKLLLEIQELVKNANDTEATKALAEGRKFVPAPLYLEASSNVNKRLYNRVGFQDNSEMVFGKLDAGHNLKLADDGTVIGGRSFGMTWMP